MKIFVAGHRGMVGSAIVRRLTTLGQTHIITRTRQELDLLDQQAVMDFMLTEKPDQVYLAAAKVGGIYANNTYPAEFIYENLMVQNNVIHAAHQSGVQKLLFLGSSCIYPREVPQPMKEEMLMMGYLEPTNEPYTPLPKLPASSCAKAITASMARITAASCPPTCTAPGTITTRKTAT